MPTMLTRKYPYNTKIQLNKCLCNLNCLDSAILLVDFVSLTIHLL